MCLSGLSSQHGLQPLVLVSSENRHARARTKILSRVTTNMTKHKHMYISIHTLPVCAYSQSTLEHWAVDLCWEDWSEGHKQNCNNYLVHSVRLEMTDVGGVGISKFSQ